MCFYAAGFDTEAHRAKRCQDSVSKPLKRCTDGSEVGEPELCFYKNNINMLLYSSLRVEIPACCDHRGKNEFLSGDARSC